MIPELERYQLVVGLECHVQLLTNSKLFSKARNHYGDTPNTLADAVDIALPGVLPVLNEKAVELAIRLGLALGCQINQASVFSRKHYFYPDLPKGYQISQFDEPICREGSLEISTNGKTKIIGIERIHIEEDAGKNIHVDGGNSSYVDYNRAGTPLLEIVTRPDIRSSEEAMEAIKSLRSLVTHLGVCDGNMQEGSMRVDVNVSVCEIDAKQFGTRTETKNLNSIRFVGQAIEFERRRQILELQSGKSIHQETRLWDSNRKESRSMRSKEEAHDYRYFPDPDLLPLKISSSKIDLIRQSLPELPKQKIARFQSELGLSEYDASILVADQFLCAYFERALETHQNAKGIANWIINDVLRVVKNHSVDNEESSFANANFQIPSESLASLVKLIDDKVISGKIAKNVFEILLSEPSRSTEEIVETNGWKIQRDTSALKNTIHEIVKQFPDEVRRYKSGKTALLGFLMGQIMKATQGKSDPVEAKELLLAHIDEAKDA